MCDIGCIHFRYSCFLEVVSEYIEREISKRTVSLLTNMVFQLHFTFVRLEDKSGNHVSNMFDCISSDNSPESVD